MKLIIDIDDNVFTRLFDNGIDTSEEDRRVIDKAVRNGMPYDERPQGEWISYNYLKQMIPTPIEDEYKYVHQIIDNAPTISIDWGIDNGDMTVYARPQGEWVDHSEEGYVECPICEHLTNCEGNIDELHYCWHCGAKLGEGGTE